MTQNKSERDSGIAEGPFEEGGESQYPDFIQPESEQEWLRKLRDKILNARNSEDKFTYLVEYCSSGISSLDALDDEEGFLKSKELLETFDKLPTTPTFQSLRDTDFSDIRTGMAYRVSIKSSDTNESVLESSEEAHEEDMRIARMLSYASLCSPFIKLMMRVTTQLIRVGVFPIYDEFTEIKQELEYLKSLPPEERKLAMINPGLIEEKNEEDEKCHMIEEKL